MKSKPLRDSAQGEQCTFQIVGVCNGNPETTVLCHLPDESHGIARKSDDISAAFGCSSCHDAIDRRSVSYEYEEHREFYNNRANKRTIKRWIEMGLIIIKGLK